MQRLPYATWTVNDVEYRLKLTTKEIVRLERVLGVGNLLNIMDGVPSLDIMLTITHAALQKFHHGITLDAVYDLYDDYVDEDGSQTQFMTEVFMNIFKASGFFSGRMTEKMDETLKEMQKEL